MVDIDQMRAEMLAIDREIRRQMTFAVTVIAGDIKAATRNHEFKNRTSNTEKSIPDPVVRETTNGAEASIVVTDVNALRMNFGTPAHEIYPRASLQAAAQVRSHKKGETQRAQAGVLRFEMEGGVRFARHVHHPGTPAYGWLDKAVDAVEPEIDAIVLAAIDEALGTAS